MTIEPPAPAMPVSGVPGGPGGYGESEVHLLDRLSVLYRYRKIVIAVVIMVLIGGAVQTYTTTKEYRATAVLRVEPAQSAIQNIGQQLYEVDESYQVTQLSILHSRKLAKRVAKKLDLKNDPEFNGTMSQPTGLGDMMLSLRGRLMSPIRSLFGSKPAPVVPAEDTAKKAETPAAQPAANAVPMTSAELAAQEEARLETPEESAMISRFLSRFQAKPQLASRLFNLEFVSTRPEFAAKALNMIAREYVDQNLEERRRELTIKQEQLRKSIDRTNEEIKLASTALQTAQAKNPNGLYLDGPTMAGIVATARERLDSARTLTTIAKAKYEALSKVKLDDPASATTVPDLANDPMVLQYQATLDELDRALARLVDTEKVAPKENRYVANRTEYETVKKKLRGRLQAIVDLAKGNYETARITEEQHQIRYDAQNAVASEMGKEGINRQEVDNRIASKQTILSDMTKQAEEAGVEASAMSNNVSIMDNAQIPTAPFKPNPGNNMMVALAVGIMLGLALAFGLDYLDDTVKTPEDITRKLHVPFLGLVPAVRGDKQPVLSGPVPHDFGEAYRALRTSLVFTSGGESTRVITVTSAQPLEGKTTTACNLAMVLAFGGSRVLLMDADMRRPGVHKALKINNTVGLSHLLVGQARVREAIQRTSDPNFCVMTAGRTPPNPSELLSSERMRQLVLNLKQGPFDWVVIDTPPVLAVTDAVILTPLVDGVTFVLGAEMTRRRLAERAVHMIMASRPKVVGAVLNRVNFDRNKYYYSRYYGYQYKSYYGTHTSATTPPKG